MSKIENIAVPMTDIKFSYVLKNGTDLTGREDISENALSTNTVDTTVKVLNLASSLRKLAVDSWGDRSYDGAIAGIGEEEDKLTFGIAVPMKSGAEVLVSVGGRDYELRSKEVRIYEVKKAGEKITRKELGLPEVKGFHAQVEESVLRGQILDMSPYKRKKPSK